MNLSELWGIQIFEISTKNQSQFLLKPRIFGVWLFVPSCENFSAKYQHFLLGKAEEDERFLGHGVLLSRALKWGIIIGETHGQKKSFIECRNSWSFRIFYPSFSLAHISRHKPYNNGQCWHNIDKLLTITLTCPQWIFHHAKCLKKASNKSIKQQADRLMRKWLRECPKAGWINPFLVDESTKLRATLFHSVTHFGMGRRSKTMEIHKSRSDVHLFIYSLSCCLSK